MVGLSTTLALERYGLTTMKLEDWKLLYENYVDLADVPNNKNNKSSSTHCVHQCGGYSLPCVGLYRQESSL